MVIEETGLHQVGNAYFMWRSSTGKTHAINPRTKKTFCNRAILQSWEPTDELPDSKHEPNCSYCKKHYDDALMDSLYGIKKDLLENIGEFLTVQVWTKNANGGLGRFTELIAKFLKEERS